MTEAVSLGELLHEEALFGLAGVTVKSVRVHFGAGGPNLLAFSVRRTKNASIFGPPPDPFC